VWYLRLHLDLQYSTHKTKRLRQGFRFCTTIKLYGVQPYSSTSCSSLLQLNNPSAEA